MGSESVPSHRRTTLASSDSVILRALNDPQSPLRNPDFGASAPTSATNRVVSPVLMQVPAEKFYTRTVYEAFSALCWEGFCVFVRLNGFPDGLGIVSDRVPTQGIHRYSQYHTREVFEMGCPMSMKTGGVFFSVLRGRHIPQDHIGHIQVEIRSKTHELENDDTRLLPFLQQITHCLVPACRFHTPMT